MPPDRAKTFADAPLDELWGVLLRQLKRPLAAHGLTLTDAQAEQIGHDMAHAAHSAPPADFAARAALLAALAAVIAESEAALLGIGFAFTESLDRTMDDVRGWETTADFLEIATAKANAELRISLAAALAHAAGETRYQAYLTKLAGGDYGEESVIARRALGA
jgi:hypothetical protein